MSRSRASNTASLAARMPASTMPCKAPYSPSAPGRGRAPATQRGFTLLEIILALALTAMLMTLLSSGVYSVVNDWNRNAETLDETLDETIAILQIERALQGAFPHSYFNQEDLGRYLYFRGLDDELRWVSTVSPQRDTGLTAWDLYSDDEGLWLRLSPALTVNPDELLERSERTLLLENYSASFSYLYQDLDDNRQWREDWPGREYQALPLAVHILLTPTANAREDAEPLNVVAPIRNNRHRSLPPTANPGTQDL